MKLSLCLGILTLFSFYPQLQGIESPVAKKVDRAKKKPTCTNPKGNVGDSKLSGCNKRTCTQIKKKAAWMEEFASENCCWQSQTAYKIGDTFSSIHNPDTGINTTLRCAQSRSGTPHIVVDVYSDDNAGLEITNDKMKEVKDLLLNVLHIIQPAPSVPAEIYQQFEGAESPVAKKVNRAKKKPTCSNPWGNVGDYNLYGCKKKTCKQIKNKAGWIEEFAYENCCWQSQTAYKIGDTFSSIHNPDTGINTTLRCAHSRSGTPHIVVDVYSDDNAGILQKEIEKNKKEVKDLLLAMLDIIEPGITPPTNTPPKTTTTTSATTITPSTTTTATTTTTTPSTTTEKLLAAGEESGNAILITGGWNRKYTTEVYFPGTNNGCSVRNYDLPANTHTHTMNTFGNKTLLCGGEIKSYCLEFTPSSLSSLSTVWTKYADLKEARYGHTSWVSSAGIVLIGGYSGFSAKAETTAELVTGGILPFTLPHIRGGCAIGDASSDSFVLTGGSFTPFKVTRYNLKGLVETMPDMNRGRGGHGCGSYDSAGKKYLIVAGGALENIARDSTEKLLIGEGRWSLVGPLPRTMTHCTSLNMNNKLYFLGGRAGSPNYETFSDILEYDADLEVWEKVGDMQVTRFDHAAAVINADFEGLCN